MPRVHDAAGRAQRLAARAKRPRHDQAPDGGARGRRPEDVRQPLTGDFVQAPAAVPRIRREVEDARRGRADPRRLPQRARLGAGADGPLAEEPVASGTEPTFERLAGFARHRRQPPPGRLRRLDLVGLRAPLGLGFRAAAHGVRRQRLLQAAGEVVAGEGGSRRLGLRHQRLHAGQELLAARAPRLRVEVGAPEGLRPGRHRAIPRRREARGQAPLRPREPAPVPGAPARRASGSLPRRRAAPGPFPPPRPALPSRRRPPHAARAGPAAPPRRDVCSARRTRRRPCGSAARSPPSDRAAPGPPSSSPPAGAAARRRRCPTPSTRPGPPRARRAPACAPCWRPIRACAS